MRAEGVVHERPGGGGLVPPQFVLHDHRVEAVVEVGGLVERQAAVLDRAVVDVSQEVGVHVGGLLQLLAVVQPGDVGLWVPVHGERETPVVVLHGVPQEEDLDFDCGQSGYSSQRKFYV